MNRIDVSNDQIRRICAHALVRSAKQSERKKYVLAAEYLNRRYGFILTPATIKIKGETLLKGIVAILTLIDYDDASFESDREASSFMEEDGGSNIPLTTIRTGGQEDSHLAILKLIYNQLTLTSKALVRIAECLESSGKARLNEAVSILEESDLGKSLRVIVLTFI
jgi:hypothetical protein